eukprot:6345985-Amphidinium_carterae.2
MSKSVKTHFTSPPASHVMRQDNPLLTTTPPPSMSTSLAFYARGVGDAASQALTCTTGKESRIAEQRDVIPEPPQYTPRLSRDEDPDQGVQQLLEGGLGGIRSPPRFSAFETQVLENEGVARGLALIGSSTSERSLPPLEVEETIEDGWQTEATFDPRSTLDAEI